MRLNGETTLFEVVRSRMLKNTLEKVRLKRVSVQISSVERRKSRKKTNGWASNFSQRF